MTSMITAPSDAPAWRTPLVVLVAGCLIAMIGFGIRSIFGLFLEPMTEARGWDRETFALAMAIQNLLWGAGVPVAGALADRFGPARVLALGAVVYGLGVYGMADAESGFALHLTGGVLTGLGVAFTAFSIALAAMARVVGPERRSLVFGLGTAAGSFGQVVFSPLGQGFIAAFGWHSALLILAASAVLIIPLAFVLPNATRPAAGGLTEQTIRAALVEAAGHRGYVLLTLGFFVCGFHVAFITVHFPAYVVGLGLAPEVGAYAIALIGLFNIVGSLLSGAVGQRYSKKSSLSLIYLLRAVAITALLLAPKTPFTIYLFAAAIGLLWLSTVPLTTGIVAQVFGLRYMATLFGIVFFSHQVGSFLGVWLGGRLYDTIGSYDPVWWAGVGLGLAAAIVHWPIDERPLGRLVAQPA
ncbi:MAG TPA: MFS transporter [Geminicoccaceae bacterium]